MKIGEYDFNGGYMGTDPVVAIYQGEELLWPTEPPIDYSSLPFTYEFETPQTVSGLFIFTQSYLFQNTPVTMVFYDENGDLIRRDDYYMNDLYMGPIPTTAVTNVKKMEFYLLGEVFSSQAFVSTSPIPDNYKVYGNILSLAYAEDFSNYTDYPSAWTGYTTSQQYNGFFAGAGAVVPIFGNSPSGVMDASHLVFPDSVFDSIYAYMFAGATNLTGAPELPATTLARNCYAGMFSGCTSLATAPELPATTLAEECYFVMFDGCSGITAAPDLPATTLAEGCYLYMFRGCTSITDSPVLPAVNLEHECYRGMFYGCSNLTAITCNAYVDENTDLIDLAGCTNMWVVGVASGGTFYKNPNSIDWWSADIYQVSYTQGSGIPDDWNIDYCYPCYDYDKYGYQDYEDCDCQLNGNCTDPCEDWEGNGYQSLEDCLCQNTMGGEDCPDCAENWESMGYESEADCLCQIFGYGCPEPEVDCSDWENLGYESEDDCSCQNYGYDTNGDPCGEPEEEPEE